MKRILSILFALVLAVALMLVPAASVGASPGPGLAGLWHFDGDALDSSGNGNDGILMGDATFAAGKFGQALSLDGSGDYVDVGGAVDNSITTALTLEAWIKYSYADMNRNGGIISNDLTWITKKGYDFFLERGKLGIDVGNGTVVGRVLYTMPAPDPVDPVWRHVAATWDGSTVTLYVDGSSVGTAALSGTYSDPGKATWVGQINSHLPAYLYPLKGLIDEVRIWDEALTVDQIADVSPPVVTINAPVDGAFYIVGMVPAGAYTVVDANSYTAGGSGWSDAVGEHTYTVTATDVLGYVGSASVTYYVVDNSYGTIGGQIIQEDGPKKKDWAKISYGGWAVLAGATKYGELEVTFHNVNNNNLDKTKFVANSIDSVEFTNTGWNPDEDEVPTPPYSDYNKVIIWATGDLVDAKTLQVVSADCEIKIQAVDTGEPGHPATAGYPDSIRIELFCDGATYDYDSSKRYGGDFDWYGSSADASGNRHYIDAGNIQVVSVD